MHRAEDAHLKGEINSLARSDNGVCVSISLVARSPQPRSQPSGPRTPQAPAPAPAPTPYLSFRPRLFQAGRCYVRLPDGTLPITTQRKEGTINQREEIGNLPKGFGKK